MPRVHLICGSTGAGKTTYAAALAKRCQGVRFSIDEWMARLFVPDRPSPCTLAWAIERIDRCEAQIWAIARQLVDADVDVVLDLGLSTREQRDRVRALVAQTRAESKLHYLDVSAATRRARVLERSRSPRDGSFQIDEATFDAMEALFEPPSDDELYGAMIVSED